MYEDSKDIIFNDLPARAELEKDGECFHVSICSADESNELAQNRTLESQTFDTEMEARNYFDSLGKN